MATGTPLDPWDPPADRLENLLLELLAFDTANPPGRTREMAEWTDSFLTNLGLETEWIVEDPAKPNLFAHLPGDCDENLLYLGHFDTVPYASAEWTHDPLGERVNDRIFGRGATDMKGPLAAMLEMLRGFVETGTSPPLSLTLGIVSDEEVAGEAGLPAVLDSRSLDAVGCVIGETTCEGGRHSISVADRGAIWVTVGATGVSAHGSRPMLGENAIDRLYDAIETIRDRVAGRSIDVPPPVESTVEESVAYYTPVMGEEAARSLFERPSINLGTMQGGESINSVPRSAQAELDIRLAPGVETAAVLADLRSCVDACAGVEIIDVSWSVGTYEDPEEPLVEAVATVAEHVTDARIYRRSSTGGGDAKRLREVGLPTVEFALGTDTVHATDEYTTTAALQANRDIYASVPFVLANSLSVQHMSNSRDTGNNSVV